MVLHDPTPAHTPAQKSLRIACIEASRTSGGGIRVGNVINETTSIYGQNAGALLGSSFVVLVIIGVVSGLLQAAGGFVLFLLAAIIRFAGYALYTGFVVKLVQDVRDGRRDQTVGDLFSAAAPAIWSLIVFGIFWGLGVAIGLVLLIVPGLILMTAWSLGAPAIVVEGKGAFEAFGRSWSLVKGSAWSVFGTLLVVLIIVIAIQFILAAIATPIGNGAIIVAAIISSVITAPFFSLAVAVMFFDLGGGSTPAAAPPAAAPPAPDPAGP